MEPVSQVLRCGLVVSSGARVPGARPEEHADLVQETFIRAFSDRARQGYDGLRAYRPYLLTIARNLLVDRARRSGKEVPSSEALEAALVAPEPEPPEPFEDPQLLRVVNEYVAALEPEQAGVYKHRYVQDDSQEETARALGLTRQRVRTVEKRLRKGLERAIRRYERTR